VALTIIDDPNRVFVASDILRLEVLPEAVFFRRTNEIDFYERFFRDVARWMTSFDEAVRKSEAAARLWGLNAMDALHVAAAIDLEADEFVTTERPTTPIHRVTAFRVTHLAPPPGLPQPSV
jgi:hypothetical protein